MKGDPCGCGCPLKTTTDKQTYASPACRRRAFEQRIGYVPPRASDRVANMRRRKPSAPGKGVRAYFSSIDEAEAVVSTLLAHRYHSPAEHVRMLAVAGRIVRALERQRTRL